MPSGKPATKLSSRARRNARSSRAGLDGRVGHAGRRCGGWCRPTDRWTGARGRCWRAKRGWRRRRPRRPQKAALVRQQKTEQQIDQGDLPAPDGPITPDGFALRIVKESPSRPGAAAVVAKDTFSSAADGARTAKGPALAGIVVAMVRSRAPSQLRRVGRSLRR